MSTNHEHNGEDELQSARRTAHALGETAGAERAAIEGELSASPQARQEAAEVELLAQRLKEAAKAAPAIEPSPALREAIERRVAELESATPEPRRRTARPWWRRHMAALALTAACLVVLAVPVARSLNLLAPAQPQQVAKLSADPSAAAAPLTKQQVQEKLVDLVDQYNRLNEEGRYEEAEVVAKNAKELAPNELVATVMVNKSRLQRELGSKGVRELADSKEASLAYQMRDVDAASAPSKASGGKDDWASNETQFRTRETAKDDTVKKIDEDYSQITEHLKQIENGYQANPDHSITDARGDRKGGGEGAMERGRMEENEMRMANSALQHDEAKVKQLFDRYDSLPKEGRHRLQEEQADNAQQNSGGQQQGDRKGGGGEGGGQIDQRHDVHGDDGDHVVVHHHGHGAASGNGDGSGKGDGTGSGSGQGQTEHKPPMPDDPPVVYPDADTWRELTERRKQKGASGANSSQDSDTPVDSHSAEVRRRREILKRELETIGAGDDKTAVLRGQTVVTMYAEYQSELRKMQREALQISQQIRSGEPLSTAEKHRLEQELRIAEGKVAAMAKETEEMERAADSVGKSSVAAEMARADLDTMERRLRAAIKEQKRLGNDKKAGPASPKKPVESWKPARVVPNASRLMVGDKEELALKGMQVDVRVDGFRARVLLDLYYFNDRPQQLEGNFQLRLPDEAAPYFFAFGRTVYQAPQVTASDSMFFKPQQVFLGDTTPDRILALRGNSWEQPKVARMVPKEKAALAYRDTVRRRIDPALVEWSGAGVFQCRVFPLAPQSLHRVTIGYDVDLVRMGDDLELRLDLPDWQSGAGAPATVVDLNVSAADARQVSLDAPATQSPGGRLAYRLVDPKQRPLMLRLRKPGTLMLTGSDDATGNYFATRVTLPLPESKGQGAGSGEQGSKERRAKRAVFLVDTSLSAGPQFPLWTKMLRATLENNRDQIKQFAVLFFNVETFWWQEKYVDTTPENVDAVLNFADNVALEGATDLGRALQEAAAPRWGNKDGGAAPDMFLLSDGAATWGEDRWGLLAGALTGQAGKPDVHSALFAYHTGLAGGDSRLLGYLAEQTGGAVFSLVGDAEIASASIAHRNRPWKLTNIEMAGSHDLLVAGRPQYVFPGQQLTIVGRLEAEMRAGEKGRKGEGENVLTFTLQQGAATQTIKIAPDELISSELAGRTYGQVATNQLEDVATLTPGPSPTAEYSGGRGESVEPVATAYARHFRITGRTCSLLMLESEQDYARFNIKPEEDSFVVKERPADGIVSKAIADTVAAMCDPKTSFLAWYGRLSTSEVHFDLPGSLKVFIDSLPAETFAVVPPLLTCKLRLRHELPENLRQPWQTGMPDYETLDAEAQRRLAAIGPDDALRCLSSLVEERPGDAGLARDLAFTAIDWQRPGEAYHLLRRAASARTFEPVTFHAMAHCLEQMASSDNHAADLAIVYYELACGGQWDARFGDMHNIALLDYSRFLRKVVAGKSEGKVPALSGYAQSRLATLTAMNLRDTADVAALIFWNTDGTDVDLHVIEPGGEECFFSHTQTASGGHISRDVTTGYGPELYLLPKAPAGRYDISAHYFATDTNRASTRTKVLAFIYENWGTPDERVAIKSLALTGRSERHELGAVKR